MDNDEWLDEPDSDGFWWITSQTTEGKPILSVVEVTLKNLDGSPDRFPVSCIGSGDCYTVRDMKNSKWQKVGNVPKLPK